MKNTKKIKLILFALCFATFFILFSGTSKVNAAVIMKVVNTNYLYARKSNSQNSDSHGHFKDGDLVEVVKCSSTWARISKETLVRNDAGIFTKVKKYKYCHMNYLTPYEPTKYTAIKKIQIRAKKSSSSESLGTISVGSTVRAVSVSTSWVQLSTGGYCLLSSLATPMYVSGTTGLLNVRAGAGTNYEIKYTLKENDIAYVVKINKAKTWAKLSDGNYCSMDYLITEREKLEKDIESDRAEQGYNAKSDISSRYYSYFTTEPVNLRKGPSTNYGIIKTLDTFTPIIAIPYKDGWYKTIDGEYISGDFIAREIIGLDLYLANFSTDRGMIVLKCSNGKNLVYHCCGGRNESGTDSSGKYRSFSTPIGSFNVFAKHKFLSSTLFPPTNGINNMDRSLFFSPDIAIHCGDPNYLSHGCIHVEDSIQNRIFDFTNVGCPVNVTQSTL